MTTLPTFDDLMNPLLNALRKLGGSGSIEEIYVKTIEITGLPEEILAQLHDPEKSSQAELKKRDLSPGDIVLEVTESVATQDASNTVHQLFTLKQAGFHIALDDFGTGFSSLSQLHEIPATELKIDISFVRRIDASDGRSMVQAIIQLASALQLRTVAEGVEDLACAQTLSQMGADVLQGNHFAKPMPLSDFAGWLQTRR